MKYFERNHSYNFELVITEIVLVEIDALAMSPFVQLKDGFLCIKAQYAWDGSSIPFKKFLGKITFGKYDGDRYCKEASLTHDGMYQLMRLKKLDRKHKDTIDRLYEKMCISGATKIIMALYMVDYDKIDASEVTYKKKRKKWDKLYKKRDKQLAALPAWAARRYWAVSKFGARTLSPRYRSEKVILET